MKINKSARKVSQESIKSEPVVEMTTSKTAKSGAGLGNRTLLDKMDKLRELGISDIVPLPQVFLPRMPISTLVCGC